MSASSFSAGDHVLDVESMFSVDGKHILVTGGGRGIGLYISEGYVRSGATVYISSRRAQSCEDAAAALTDLGPGRCIAVPQDLSTTDGCAELARQLVDDHSVKKLDCVVHNSGCSWGEPLEEHQEKGWDKVMNLNVKALFYLTVELLPLLRAAATDDDPARIITIGSVAGIQHQAAPTFGYDVSKAAVHHLTRKLAAELASDNITVNAIAPGLVPSDMSKQLLTYAPAEILTAGIPLGRAGRKDDMAGAALFLASRAGAWITGHTLVVDGGNLVGHSSL